MGLCVSKKKQNQKNSHNPKNIGVKNNHLQLQNIQACQQQLKHLHLIYADLASRAQHKQMNLENFQLFFHKNGFWGQRLFAYFDTSNTNTITESQFTRGIVRISRANQQQKIEILYKFFSDGQYQQGISFNNFLKMLYNYPKEDLKIILNDTDFINKQLKKLLVSTDGDLMGKRYESLNPIELQNKVKDINHFKVQPIASDAERKQSDYIMDLYNRKSSSDRQTDWQISIDNHNVQVKTSSIHNLVKKYARSIFCYYNINQKTGKLSYDNFRDWIMHHKNLYNVYYEGFHFQAWQVKQPEKTPIFLTNKVQYSTKAQMVYQNKTSSVVISLLHSILVVFTENDLKNPILIICLQGLSVNSIVSKYYGFGFKITHQDQFYPSKQFYFLNQKQQQSWMDHLKYFKGASINQLYQIKQKIGAGKFSIVYSCVLKSTGKQYAVKVIQSYKLSEQSRITIAHESQIMSLMSHPFLAFHKETLVTKTHIYIITELIKGKDLFDFIHDYGCVQQSQAKYIIQQVIIGVKYIHSLGIVHRDLKPQNIMIQYNQAEATIGRIKIIDFGFANYLQKLRQMPKQQLLAGTPNYIAPQILRDENFDQKIDNFAIGSIMYYLLSANLPFNSKDVTTILQRTIEGQYQMTNDRWKNISKQAKDLINNLLQNNHRQRISLEKALQHPWFQSLKQNNYVPYIKLSNNTDTNKKQLK